MTESFLAPDTGLNRPAYCCSFHWFALNDGRTMGLDVIRNGNVWLLRMFVVEQDGRISGIVADKPHVAGRNGGFIVGAAGDYGFDLQVKPQGAVHDSGWALELGLVNLAARDYLEVRYQGEAWIGAAKYTVDSVGTASVHYGRFLPQYGYLVSLRRDPGILLAATARDNFRWLPIHRWTYGYGSGILPGRVFTAGEFSGSSISLGRYGALELFDLRTFPHELLGQPTVTATADAVYVPRSGKPVGIGRVVLDCRGESFMRGPGNTTDRLPNA